MISPVSVDLAQIIESVLPTRWRQDAESVETIQWVVYCYLEATDEDEDVKSRVRYAIEKASDQLGEKRTAVKRVCTTRLYNGDSSSPPTSFQNALVEIESRYEN